MNGMTTPQWLFVFIDWINPVGLNSKRSSKVAMSYLRRAVPRGIITTVILSQMVSLSISSGTSRLFLKRSESKSFWLHGTWDTENLCCNYCNLLLWSKTSHRHWAKEWIWLYSNKALGFQALDYAKPWINLITLRNLKEDTGWPKSFLR